MIFNSKEFNNEYYSILKNTYSFSPQILTIDYALSNKFNKKTI